MKTLLVEDKLIRWKPIINYPEYEVSTAGFIRRIKSGRILRFGKDKRGYLLVTLCRNGKPRKYYAHRLVACEFIGAHVEGMQVNHIDGCKTNNNVNNLEWVTGKKNVQHAFMTGLNKPGEHLKNPLTHPSFKGYILAKSLVTGDERVMCGEKDLTNNGFTATLVYRCVNGKLPHHKNHTFMRLVRDADI